MAKHIFIIILSLYPIFSVVFSQETVRERGYEDYININLSEVIITAKVPHIQVKGDTLEYFAAAYMKNRDILLQDMLRNIPGMKINADGSLFINNKPVNKILIDGKEFFGRDIQIALKNIPSEMIHKLQVYNKQTDISELMGIKEISDNQVLNLELKDEFKNSIFGNAQLGFGNNSRYHHKFMLSKLSTNTQLTALGNMNNIHNDESGIGAELDEPGLQTSKTIGINFNTEQIKNLKTESNIIYTENTDHLKSNEIAEYFLSSDNRHTHEQADEKESTRKSKLETSLEWTPKSNLSVHLQLRESHDDIKTNQASNLKSFITENDSTTEHSQYESAGYKNDLSGMLTIGYKLNDEGRNLILQLDGSIDNSLEKGMNKSTTTYHNQYEKTLDQKLYNKNKMYNWGKTLTYTEPLKNNQIVYLSYSLNNSISNRDKNVLNADKNNTYSIVDSTYSRQYKETELNHIIRLGYQSIKKKHEYSFNLSIEPSLNKSRINLGDSIIHDIKQKVLNYTGLLKMSYKPQKSSSIDFTYSGKVNAPNTTQLSTDTTTINTMNKVYGNPSLKSSFTNSLNLQYQYSNFKTGQFFILSAGVNLITNQIAEFSKMDMNGNTETTYKNINGNWGIDFNFIFNTPLRNERFTIDNNTTATYHKNSGFINDNRNIIRNYNLQEYLTINFDSDIFKSSLQIEGELDMTKTNLSTSDKRILNYGISNSTYANLKYDISLQNNIGYKQYSGYSDNTKKNELLWSISLSKQVLKGKGLLSFYIYDILNQKNNIIKTQKNNKIAYITGNSLKRHFLISFLYRFNIDK